MSSPTTHITITGHQLQQALAYVAPDLTQEQLRDRVRIELIHQEDGHAVAAAVTMEGLNLAAVPLDDHLQWPEQHPDDRVVDGWSSALKDRMAKCCGRGRPDRPVQGRLPDGWYRIHQHPDQETILHAAREHWEKELVAFELKRQAYQMATRGQAAQGKCDHSVTPVETASGASYRSLSVDIRLAEEHMDDA